MLDIQVKVSTAFDVNCRAVLFIVRITSRSKIEAKGD